MKKIKIGLQAGGCGVRWHCKNINKKICNPVPKKGKNYVKCKYYEFTTSSKKT